MARLDTHVAVWLYAGAVDQLSEAAASTIEREPIVLCPLVRLELACLHEIGRVSADPADVIAGLIRDLGAEMSVVPFADVVSAAVSLDWTRDPFDRLLVADAICGGDVFVTRDRAIRSEFPAAVW